jgi:hypothetical protein
MVMIRRILIMRTSVLLPVLFLVSAAGVAGQSNGSEKNYSGSIDNKFGIEMTLKQAGSSLEGSYFYTRVKKPIHLKGAIDAAGNVTLEETGTGGAATAAFKGRFISDGVLSGAWAKTSAKAVEDPTLPFTVELETSPGHLVGADDRALVQQSEAVLVHKGLAGRDPSEGGSKSARVRYPVIAGLKNPAVLAKVQAAVSLKSTTNESLDELRKDFADLPGLDGVDYKVNYDRDYILDLTVTESTTGAYPDSEDFYVAVNLKTGEKLKATDVFKAAAIKTLVARANQQLNAYIKEMIEDEKKRGEDPPYIDPKRFDEKEINNFSVSDAGITFLWSFGFPHVIKALEPPDGGFVFTYEQLKDVLNPNGLLGARLH